MKSVGQVTKALPDDFVKKVYQLFTPGQADQILQAYAAERPVTMRVNTLKTTIQEVMSTLKEHSIKFDRVLWFEQALVVKNATEQDIEQLDIYKQGHVYLQSLSSMIPPLLLKPTPGDAVLDLTAAPGGKTTQLACMMDNSGEILAVEKNKIRFERMVFNLNLQGVVIAQTLNVLGESVGKNAASYFDRVLLDAPCSGEGVFNITYAGSYRHWSPKFVRKCANTQKRLFASAFEALKPKGFLVYSTCTLSPEENELLVQWALEEYQGRIEVLPSRLPKLPFIPAFAEFDGQELSPEVRKAIRIVPSQLMEGFFCCRFQKIY